MDVIIYMAGTATGTNGHSSDNDVTHIRLYHSIGMGGTFSVSYLNIMDAVFVAVYCAISF